MAIDLTDNSVINDVELKEAQIRVIAGYDTATWEMKEIGVNSQWWMVTTDIWLEIAKWTFPWITPVNKFWADFSADTTESLVRDNGWVYTFLTSASVLDIQSTSVNDTSAWTWARTISVQWLDWDYNLITETVTLNWTSTVNTTNSFIRVFRMLVLTAWSLEAAEWTITAEVSSVVKAQINNWNNQTLMATYTIPAWKTGYLLYGKASTWQWKNVTFKFKSRPVGWVFNLKHTFNTFEWNYDYRYQIPLQIPEKTDLVVTAQVTTWTAAVSAVFDLILIDN